MTESGGQQRLAQYDPDIPMQHQIFVDLCKQITDGLWVDRADFPGGKELTEIYGVSKITAERVMDRLVEGGWIERTRGRRPTVIFRASAAPAKALTAGFLGTGHSRPFTYQLLSRAVAVAPSEACQVFGVPAGSRLWVARRLRKWQGIPHSVVHHVQLPTVGEGHRLADLKSKSMLAILAAEGKQLARATRQFSVRPASREDAHALDVTLGQPTLAATFVMYDDAENVLQWLRIQLHPSVETPLESYDTASGAGWVSPENL
jgi:GntR family transcriptional regulator